MLLFFKIPSAEYTFSNCDNIYFNRIFPCFLKFFHSFFLSHSLLLLLFLSLRLSVSLSLTLLSYLSLTFFLSLSFFLSFSHQKKPTYIVPASLPWIFNVNDFKSIKNGKRGITRLKENYICHGDSVDTFLFC